MKRITKLLLLAITVVSLYGAGRLYFYLTDGFSPKNIVSDFPYHPEWEIRPLKSEETAQLEQALNQPYHYLAKGCQSYVFLSEDQHYVIKFFKYHNYRLKPWLVYFPPLPAIVKYREQKKEKKQKVIDRFLTSWKLAFDHLKEETGLLFVHLNKTSNLQTQLLIYDKLGRSHYLDLDQLEFCVQKRAEMIQPVLLRYKEEGDLQKSQEFISNLLQLHLFEYARGFADMDHALMQNTGVIQGRPIHIDVGLFAHDEKLKDPAVYHQELFNRTYKLQKWLDQVYPELAPYLREKMQAILGDSYAEMKPKLRRVSR